MKSHNTSNILLTSLLLSCLALGGCDTFRNTFRLTHSSPNEWDTPEPNPVLILPPDFKERPKLPPPTPGTPNPHAIPEITRVHKTVLGEEPAAPVPAPTTKGEEEIIENASKNQPATPNIRDIVDREAQEEATISGKVIAKIKHWKKTASQNLGLSQKDASDNDSKSEDEKDDGSQQEAKSES